MGAGGKRRMMEEVMLAMIFYKNFQWTPGQQ
jgi:hypothetical protein